MQSVHIDNGIAYQALPTIDPDKRNDSQTPASDSEELMPEASPRLLDRRSNTFHDIFGRMMKRQSQRGETGVTGLMHGLENRRLQSQHMEDVELDKMDFFQLGNFVLESFPFQVFMAFAIVANAAVIGFETDNPDLKVWDLIEAIFLIVFTGELGFRLIVTGCTIFFDPESPEFTWNCFDFAIVGLGLFDTATSKYAEATQEKGQTSGGGGGFSTLFRIIRLLRILRIFRIVRFLKQLYMLVFGFGVAAVATVWVTILAIVILYVCSIIMVRMVQASDRNDADYPLYKEKFGSVAMAMFTLFQLMLNPDLSIYEESLSKYIFIAAFLFIFVVFGSFGMLALLTGVISESMFEKNQVRLEEDRVEREQKRKMLADLCSDLFDEIAMGEHEVSVVKLKGMVPKLIEIFMKFGFAFTEYDLLGILEVTDTDDSGGIDKAEFQHAVCSSSEGIQAATVMELHQSVMLIGVRAEKRNEHLLVQLEAVMDGMERINSRLDSLTGSSEPLFPEGRPVRRGSCMARIQSEGRSASKEVAKSDSSGAAAPPPDSPIDRDLMTIPPVIQNCIPVEGNSASSNPAFYVGIDSKLALKIDSCEAMVREMRRTVAEIANSSRELLKRTLVSSGTVAHDQACNSRLNFGFPDPWDELDFVAPLEVPDMWEKSKSRPAPSSPQGDLNTEVLADLSRSKAEVPGDSTALAVLRLN